MLVHTHVGIEIKYAMLICVLHLQICQYFEYCTINKWFSICISIYHLYCTLLPINKII